MTSGTYTFNLNRNQVITDAFRKIGVLGDWQTLDANQEAAGVRALDPMLKAWAKQHGMPLWAIEEQYIPMSNWSSGHTVTIGPSATINQIVKPLRILQAIRRDVIDPSNPNDIPMNIYTWEDYESLANKDSQGAPVHIFYQPQRVIGAISLWPRPDTYWQTNGQLYIRYSRQIQDAGSPTDVLDFPVEWIEALVYNLAYRLSSDYGVEIVNRQALKEDAQYTLEAALQGDTEEGSLFLQPRKQ